MTLKRACLIGALTGTLIVVLAPTAQVQTVNTQIQIAINQLVTGVTPFTALRNVAGAYMNWGTVGGVNGYGFRDNGGTIQVKDSGGSWTNLGGSGNPTNASYWTRVPEASLSNETALSALATALLLNTTTTGVPVAYAGTSCTNQFVRALSAVGVATCATVSLTTDVTGILPIGNGGLGLTSGTSGGVLGFTASGTLASSVLLTADELVVGGGAGATPVPLGSPGTTTTVLHGNASGAPTFSAVGLTTDVSGILPSANGGTGTAFFAVSGPATSTKTYTFPNASTTVLTTNTAVTAAQGGTGQSSYTIGDLLQASGVTTLSRLAATSTGNALISGGVGTASSWGKIGLTTHISGTLGPTNGGTGFASYTVGDVLYANSTISLARLNAGTTGYVLTSNGPGVAPSWQVGVGLRSVTVPIANADVVTLPTTPVTLIAAPPAGFRIRLIAASLVLRVTMPYGGIDATSSTLQIETAGGSWIVEPVVNDNPTVTDLTDFLSSSTDLLLDMNVPALFSAGGWTTYITTSNPGDADAQAIRLAMDNNGAGNLSGGDSANSLTVTVYYTLEAL